MSPEEVEQMLYDHAIKTKIRSPLPERKSNLGYNRIVAGAALVCSLVMSKSGSAGETNSRDTDSSKRPVYHVPQPSDRVDSSLAMSPVG